MKDTYTTALLQLLTPDADVSVVLAGFKRTLQERGHEALYGPVLRRVERRLRAARPTSLVTVTDQAAYAAQAEAVRATLAELGAAEAATTIETDPTIVGGYIAEHKSRRHDHSYKAKLVTLYRNLTNN